MFRTARTTALPVAGLRRPQLLAGLDRHEEFPHYRGFPEEGEPANRVASPICPLVDP